MRQARRLLLTNARIYRSAFDKTPAEAILLEGDKVAWVGEADAAPPADEMVRLRGATVLPGLTEAHVHLLAIAQGRLQLSFASKPVPDIGTLLTALAERARATRAGHWVAAADLDEDRLQERRLPTRQEIDAAVPDHPVLLRRYCGHVAVLNSAALQTIGIPDSVADPVGGAYGRSSAGTLDGSAYEKAAERIFGASTTVSSRDLVASLHATIADCVRLGFTAAVEAAIGFTNGFDQEDEIWSAIRRDGPLPMRMGFMLQLDPAEARSRRYAPAMDRDWQRTTLKYFADGIVGGRTAAVSEPYLDTGTCGFFTRPEDELRQVLVEAHRAGWQIAVHAIGDRAIDLVIAAFELAQRKFPRPDARHRIEHFFCPPANGVARMQKLGAVVVTQPNFVLRMNKSIRAAFGHRADAYYPARTLVEAGVAFAASSDAPTGILSPWVNMAVASDRAASTGSPIGVHEALHVRQAIASYTAGGPYAMMQERWRGELIPGMAADVVVVDRDPVACSPERLAETRVLMTIVRGERVFDNV